MAGNPITPAEALSRAKFAGATGPTRPNAPGPDRDLADRVAVKLADYLAAKCDAHGTPLPLTNDDASLVLTRAMQLAGEYRRTRHGRPTA